MTDGAAAHYVVFDQLHVAYCLFVFFIVDCEIVGQRLARGQAKRDVNDDGENHRAEEADGGVLLVSRD